jgi:hypothetical protein
MKCASVRKKGSLEQCPANALFGHTLCGSHARARTTVLWADANASKTACIIKIQAFVRGGMLRKRLRRNGPGVLHRSGLSNDEDLVTCEDKDRQDPQTYFAFNENGKIWWFDYATISNWVYRSSIPLNPYTKVPLDIDTKRRMFQIWCYRFRCGSALTEPTTAPDVLAFRINMLCQLFSCYGFGDIDPTLFRRFGKVDYHSIFLMIRDDIGVAYRDGNPIKERIKAFCTRGIHLIHTQDSHLYVIGSIHRLLCMCVVPKDPYILLFTMLSAIYRC